MNLEGIKKTFSKIPAWVKANPKKAAVIGVAFVVIAYFAIKRGASESGEELTSAPDSNSLDSLGGGLSEIESGGLGGGTSAPESSEVITTETIESGGGYSGGGYSESDFSISDMPSGFVNPAPSFSGSSAAIIADPIASTFRAASEMAGIKSVISETGVSARINNPVVRPVAPAKTVTPVKTVSSLNKLGGQGGGGLIATVAPAKTITPVKTVSSLNKLGGQGGGGLIASSKTDSEKAGLSKYFTGTSGGRRYVAGSYVGAAVTTVKKSLRV